MLRHFKAFRRVRKLHLRGAWAQYRQSVNEPSLQDRVFRFACRVLLACPETILHLASREVWRQLVRAAPSTSNNLEEADEASSTRDFIAKMKIALREAKEARRCLRFVKVCRLANHERLGNLEDEAGQIASIFAAIVINTRRRAEEEKKKRKSGKPKE